MENKKRLIDANELLSNGFITENVRFKRERFCIPWGDIKRSVKNAPTIDAVEVVRCKDCANAVRHEVFPHSRRCKVEDRKFSHKETHFCSYGERKNDGMDY